MELRDLQSFMAVAEARGFRAAANQLEVEQSALSRRVRHLEDELGVSLFERLRGGVRLTRAGERFQDDIRSILTRLQAATVRAQHAGAGRQGRLTIGVGATLFGGRLRKLILDWRAQHDEVELSFEEASPQEHIAKIQSRQVDVAVVAGADWGPICEVEELWREPVNVVIPASAASDFTVPVPPISLADWTFLVSHCGFGPQVAEWIVRRLSDLSRSPRIVFVDASRSVLFSMVGLELGATFATGAEAEVAYPNVAFLPVEGESIPYSALWCAGNDNPALRRFLSLARMEARAERALLSRTLDPSP